MLPKITFLPPSCKRFFRHARKIVGSCHRDHLWRVVILIASTHGHRSLSKIEKATGRRRSRQAISHFLSEAEWDAPELLREHARDTLRKLGWRAGDTLYVILDDTQKRKLSGYGAKVLARDGRAIAVRGKKHRLAERVGRLSKADRVKLVFSRRPGETAWIALATDQSRWGMKTVLAHYLKRWGIEVFFKMSKQYLGLGDYQVLRYRAVERYLHLVLIAYLLLTHLALSSPDVQAALKTGTNSLRLPSIPQLQEQLRATLWEDAFQHMEKFPLQRKIARKIREIFNMRT
jgi:SRSO17 transposase